MVKKKLLFIGIITIIAIIGVCFYIIQNNNDVEQYYINGKNCFPKDFTNHGLNLREDEKIINNYNEYLEYFGEANDVQELLKNRVDENFFKNSSLIVYYDSFRFYSKEGDIQYGKIEKLRINRDKVIITIKYNYEPFPIGINPIGSDTSEIEGTFFIPVNNKNIQQIQTITIYPGFYIRVFWIPIVVVFLIPIIVLIIIIKSYKKNIKRINNDSTLNEEEKKVRIKNEKKSFIFKLLISGCFIFMEEMIYRMIRTFAAKPIIYLYPKQKMQVTVKLKNEKNITVSYPKYNKEWKVLANTNGDLIDINTGRNLYSLYYECKNKLNFKQDKEGFIVEGINTASFLEEKLAVLGLNEKEAEEFIIYWLPKLEVNKYNYIRFATLDEIEENMPIEINPTPDSCIRILMIFKGLNKPISIKEQNLITQKREGFTAVEWGGIEL